MDPSKYDGTIHPNEWLKQLRRYYYVDKQHTSDNDFKVYVKSMVDSTIPVPEDFTDSELINSLRQHITFTVFKNSCKRKLRMLNFIPERLKGDTARFLANFRSLCHNAEIDDIEEIKTYFYKTLPNGFIQDTFVEQMNNNVNSMSELTQLFENILLEDSILIRNGSRVSLKHVATGKYLSSLKKCYQNTNRQMVYAGSIPNSDAQWIINFNGEFALNESTVITLEHDNSKDLGVTYNENEFFKSPTSKQSEVSCASYLISEWNFKSKNNLKYLKSHDIVILQINYRDKRNNDLCITLRSHDFTFTVDNDTYQEVVAHEERIGGNDEWCIELIKYN